MKKKFWHWWIKPSTLAFIQEAQQAEDFSLFDLLHGYVYGRWPYLYIGIGTGEHWVARTIVPILNSVGRIFTSMRGAPLDSAREAQAAPSTKERQKVSFADTYHGKVVPPQAARQLVMVNEEIRLENLEQVIPYARARDIVLKNPGHIIVLDCPCRASRPNPCLPMDVCLVVGEPFASFVFEHHPGRSRWISSQEAVEILEAEHARGHVHHAFFKDAMLGRFYAICNCCSCCCGAVHAHQHGTPMLASSGYVAEIDEDLCIGCGSCQETCQFGALSLDGYTTHVDREACMGCGVCVSQCVQGALVLVRDAARGEPLEIVRLLEESNSAGL